MWHHVRFYHQNLHKFNLSRERGRERRCTYFSCVCWENRSAPWGSFFRIWDQEKTLWSFHELKKRRRERLWTVLKPKKTKDGCIARSLTLALFHFVWTLNSTRLTLRHTTHAPYVEDILCTRLTLRCVLHAQLIDMQTSCNAGASTLSYCPFLIFIIIFCRDTFKLA